MTESTPAVEFNLYSLEKLKQTSTHGFAELRSLTILVCEGVDASAFLQGQLTCDVDALYTAGSGLNPASLGSCCTPQGRMVGLFYIAKITSECFWLFVDKSNAPQVLSHLKKYSVFSKVSLQNNPDNLFIYGMISPHENSPLHHRDPDIKIIPLGDRDNRYFFHVTTTIPETQHFAVPLDEKYWQLGLLLLGVPQFDETLSNQFMPSDLHIDQLGGVSYKKGCYTGQEPIARLHFKGIPKFCCVLVGWPMQSNEKNQTDMTELPDVSLNGKKIGSLIKILALNNQYLGLARIRIDSFAAVHADGLLLTQLNQEARLVNLAYNTERELEIMQGTSEDAQR